MSDKPEVRHTPAPWDPYPKTGVRFVELSIDDYRHAVRCVNAHAETLAESLLSSSEERRNRRRHQPQPECAYGDPVCDCAEAREVHCPSCSKAGGADMTVSHAPPVCDPKPQPEAREVAERALKAIWESEGRDADLAAVEAVVAPLVLKQRVYLDEITAQGKRIAELEAERDMRERHQQELTTLCSKKEERAEKAEAERDALREHLEGWMKKAERLENEVEQLRVDLMERGDR